MFRHVPACSGMFRSVPCSGFYRHPTGNRQNFFDQILVRSSGQNSGGVDKIPARLLKETADTSAVPLSMLFNLSFRNRDAYLNYENQLILHPFTRMVIESQ